MTARDLAEELWEAGIGSIGWLDASETDRERAIDAMVRVLEARAARLVLNDETRERAVDDDADD
jgi:hypothetical protein